MAVALSIVSVFFALAWAVQFRATRNLIIANARLRREVRNQAEVIAHLSRRL